MIKNDIVKKVKPQKKTIKHTQKQNFQKIEGHIWRPQLKKSDDN